MPSSMPYIVIFGTFAGLESRPQAQMCVFKLKTIFALRRIKNIELNAAKMKNIHTGYNIYNLLRESSL
jgi:hypothetical protein